MTVSALFFPSGMQTAVASNQPAQRLCALQEDPVLLLQAALQAVEALLVQLCAFGSGG